MESKGNIIVGSALFNGSETQRMVEIATSLVELGYNIIYLGEGKYDSWLDRIQCERVIPKADKNWFSENRVKKMLGLNAGADFATYEEIDEIVQEEVEIIKKYDAKFVLTGYRISLTASARIAGVPIAWCLSAVVSHPYLRLVDKEIKSTTREEQKKFTAKEKTKYMFGKITTNILLGNKTSAVWNKYLIDHGVKGLDDDLEIYRGDLNLLSDAPELFEYIKEDEHNKFMGPIFNYSNIEMDDEIKDILDNTTKKKVLISTGTAGLEKVYNKLLESLKDCDYEIFISNLGKMTKEEMSKYPDNFHFREIFPLIDIMKKCDACLIQGGQGTIYASLYAGNPFVATTPQFEQFYNIDNILNHNKCGIHLEPSELTPEKLKECLKEILFGSSYKEEMNKISEKMQKYYDGDLKAGLVAAKLIDEYINK